MAQPWGLPRRGEAGPQPVRNITQQRWKCHPRGGPVASRRKNKTGSTRGNDSKSSTVLRILKLVQLTKRIHGWAQYQNENHHFLYPTSLFPGTWAPAGHCTALPPANTKAGITSWPWPLPTECTSANALLTSCASSCCQAITDAAWNTTCGPFPHYW